jgi:transcriptional regulator with XRE-family HTH domain
MEMVKIDGAKIKTLREQQGLTQLYLATAVQVTTDTISRWENKRYPSIKKENGIKLAQALGVELDDLIEQEVAPAEELATIQEQSPFSAPLQKNSPLRKSWPILLLSATVAAIIGLVGWVWLHTEKSNPFVVQRVLPPHCVLGQSFPVLLQVTGQSSDTIAVLIKENLPSNARFLAASPATANSVEKDNQLKWLKKVGASFTFAYVIKIEQNTSEPIQFSGTFAIGAEDSPQQLISGKQSLDTGFYHWADTNKDHVISDAEILAVYDRYSELTDIDLDLDLIEKIWLGSGYTYQPGEASFIITE